jgi:hypothetical protein
MIPNGNSNVKQDGSLDVNTVIPEVDWTVDHEDILIEWADKAMCFRWLHSRAHALYSKLNYNYTIPVIVISTLTGTANFAQDRVPEAYQGYFVMIVGGFNILAGIITTIQQFLKITQLNEAHRVSGIAWDKFYRNIKIELSKHPDERLNVTQMIKISKEEFDRLMETSPTIPDKIIQTFKSEFNKYNEDNNTDTDPEHKKPKIITPEICDSLVSTELSRNPWSSEENRNKKLNQIINKEKQNLEVVINFQKTFFDLNNREPLESEIIDNLKDKIDINILTKSIEKIKKTKETELISSLSVKIDTTDNINNFV